MNLFLLIPLVPLHMYYVAGFTSSTLRQNPNWAAIGNDGIIIDKDGKQATSLHQSTLSYPITQPLQQQLDAVDERIIHPSDLDGSIQGILVAKESEGELKKKSKVIVNNSNAELRRQDDSLSEKKVETPTTSEVVKRIKTKSKVKMRTIVAEGGLVATLKKAIKNRRHRGNGLSRKEVAKLVYKIHELREVMNLKEDFQAMNNGVLPTEEEWAQMMNPPISSSALKQIIIEGHRSRAHLLAGNIGLVVDIAKRYSEKDGIAHTASDLTQEGSLGLLEAAERFYPERGYKFSTYATWWVRQRITKAISDHSRAIRLPAHVTTMLSRVEKARSEFEHDVGRVPSLPELAYKLSVPIEKLRMYEDSSLHVLSLERPLRKESDSKSLLGDSISSDIQTPDDYSDLSCLRDNIRSAVSELSAEERNVLVLRFGLNDGSAKTIVESSKLLGISKDRVRLVEAKALNKLRHPGRTHRLEEYARVPTDEKQATDEKQEESADDVSWLF